MRTILVLSYCLCLTLLVQTEDDPILAFLTTTEKTTDPLLRLLAEETEDQIDDLSTETTEIFPPSTFPPSIQGSSLGEVARLSTDASDSIRQRDECDRMWIELVEGLATLRELQVFLTKAKEEEVQYRKMDTTGMIALGVMVILLPCCMFLPFLSMRAKKESNV